MSWYMLLRREQYLVFDGFFRVFTGNSYDLGGFLTARLRLAARLSARLHGMLS